MTRKITFLCAIVFTAFLGARDVVKDPEINIGKLPNGLTYYIKKNQMPKERAALTLVVKAGGIHEEENQRGFAHLLEHMVFRGSEHFTDGEVEQYLESIGAESGPDMNAFTSHDVTCYELDIPLENQEALAKSIFILSDWAARAKIDQAILDKEKQVVVDEGHVRGKSAWGRFSEAFLGHYMAGSRYAARLPLGGPDEIIESCTSEDLRAFYTKWYHPDRMAIIVVGDFDVEMVKKEIETSFGNIPANQKEVEEVSTEVQFPKSGDIFFIHEPELTHNHGWLASAYTVNYSDQKNSLKVKNGTMVQILIELLNERYDKAAQANPAPFLGASFSASDLSFYHEMAQIFFIPFEDRPLEALKTAYTEFKRMKEFGPSKEEFRRSIKKKITWVKQALANLDIVDHDYYVSKCLNSFIHDIPVWDRKDMLECTLEELQTLTLEEIQAFAKEVIQIDTFSVGFASPIKNFLTKDQVENFLLEMEKIEVQAVENKCNELKINNLPCDNKEIISKFTSPSLGYEILELGNGMKVILHKSSLEKGEIQLQLFALGGRTLLEEEEFSSSEFLSSLLYNSGFENLNGIEFSEYLDECNLFFSFGIDRNLRSIFLGGSGESQEEMFKVLNAFFTKKKFSVEAWDNISSKIEELDKYAGNDPYHAFFKEASAILHSNHPFYQEGSFKEANLERMVDCCQKLFTDPSEFTLVIVGDFEPAQMKEYLQKYLSVIKQEKCEKEIKFPLECFPKESMTTNIYRGKDSHTYNIVAYGITGQEFDSVGKAGIQARALSYLLSKRISAKLREDLGGTYTPKVHLDFPLYPELRELNAYVIFTSSVEKSSFLQGEAQAELGKVVREGFSQEEIDTAKEILTQGAKRHMEENHYWLHSHEIAALDGSSLEEIVDFHTRIEAAVTNEALQALAVRLFDQRPAIQITLLPEGSAIVNE